MIRRLLVAFVIMTNIAIAGTPVSGECLAFERYTVAEIFSGPYVKPNVSSPEQVHRFRTVVREGSVGAPDFAGHFRVVHWGCGSNCHLFALVDKKTGRVYPVHETAALGASFRLSSALFIMDPPEMIEDSTSSLISTKSFAWSEQSESLIAIAGCDGYALTEEHRLDSN